MTLWMALTLVVVNLAGFECPRSVLKLACSVALLSVNELNWLVLYVIGWSDCGK